MARVRENKNARREKSQVRGRLEDLAVVGKICTFEKRWDLDINYWRGWRDLGLAVRCTEACSM